MEFPDIPNHLYDLFQLSQILKKLTGEAMYVPLDNIQLDESLSYIEQSVMILEGNAQVLV